jgi:hypothetical protein
LVEAAGFGGVSWRDNSSLLEAEKVSATISVHCPAYQAY